MWGRAPDTILDLGDFLIMYLHLGEGAVVAERDIVGIFDLDTATVSTDTRSYLRHLQDEGRVRAVGTELPKSFIVVMEDGKELLYTSQISSATLLKRTIGR